MRWPNPGQGADTLLQSDLTPSKKSAKAPVLDSADASVAAGRTAPMLLTQRAAVPATTLKQLKRLKSTCIYLTGGPLANSTAAEAQVLKAVPNAQFIATGARFPDGLTVAVAAGYNGALLLLVTKICLPHRSPTP